MNPVALEFRKLHRKHLWLTVFLVLGFELVWAVVALTMSLSHEGAVPHDSAFVIAQVSQIHGIFAPVLATVLASRIAAMEHDGGMMPVLFAANQSRTGLFRAKFFAIFAATTIATIVGFLAVLGYGATKGVTADWYLIGVFFAGCVLANAAVISIQLTLALLFTRQAVTLSVGIIGGLLGSFAGFMPALVSMFLPWQYVGLVTPVRMHVIDGRIAGFPMVPEIGLHLLIVAAVGAISVLVCQAIFSRRSRD
ncbi:ABC transporter permease [Paeniglutamicibacter sp. NPDC012692]|uniref:ABC transporter permease n=1 Tax=Paeniglutamicibacter sp. NPDC012692 TaxID=3364388 RepID=UPI00368B9210